MKIAQTLNFKVFEIVLERDGEYSNILIIPGSSLGRRFSNWLGHLFSLS